MAVLSTPSSNTGLEVRSSHRHSKALVEPPGLGAVNGSRDQLGDGVEHFVPSPELRVGEQGVNQIKSPQ